MFFKQEKPEMDDFERNKKLVLNIKTFFSGGDASAKNASLFLT